MIDNSRDAVAINCNLKLPPSSIHPFAEIERTEPSQLARLGGSKEFANLIPAGFGRFADAGLVAEPNQLRRNGQPSHDRQLRPALSTTRNANVV